MIHDAPHPLAGQIVKLNLVGRAPGLESGDSFCVEDYWDRVSGGSWMYAQGNPAALQYAMRSGLSGLPTDNEVVYGKSDRGLGHIVHVSELVEPSTVGEPS